MSQFSSLLSFPRGGVCKVFGLLVLLGSLFGCSSFSGGDPPLPDSTFTRVMNELQVLSARADRSSLPPGLQDSIFARYGVEREDFNTTLRYYSRHPSEFESLFNAAIDSLNAIDNRQRQGRTPPEQARSSSP